MPGLNAKIFRILDTMKRVSKLPVDSDTESYYIGLTLGIEAIHAIYVENDSSKLDELQRQAMSWIKELEIKEVEDTKK
jgi:hypothetical protein